MNTPIDTERLLLIVTGAHLRAERSHRPLAYRLHDVIAQRFAGDDAMRGALDVLVCSDLWYLNNEDLRHRPTISIGEPGVNALAAFLADRLEPAFVVDDVLSVQLDLDGVDLVASCWGTTPGATASAIDAFVERYLDAFLTRAAGAGAA
ncbi:MAG: hypothetical protein KDA20_06765 [Phycisphaerales bacterium]|nr:hypothetical protein [Phycisphaerales bacterium]